MTSLTDARLAALIGSRICHDLISPIGAINNGLELLGMTGGATGPEMELISDSVVNAAARIRFFRIAFGTAGEQMVADNEARGVVNDMAKSGRVRMRYEAVGQHSRQMIRLAFLALLCVEDALPYGGEITVTQDDATGWRITGAADKLNIDPGLWSGLADPAALSEVEPAHVQFALLPVLLREARIPLHTEIGTTSVEIRF